MDAVSHQVKVYRAMLPVLLKLRNGDLLAVVRAGDYHFGERGRLECVRSKDGGMSWSQPSVIVADGPDDRNPAAIQCSNGKILVIFGKSDNYVNGEYSDEKAKAAKPALWITRSEDHGHTWGQAEQIPAHWKRPVGVYGKMIELPDKAEP